MGSHPRALLCMEHSKAQVFSKGDIPFEHGQIFSRSVPCIIILVKASQISVISDGLWFGKTLSG